MNVENIISRMETAFYDFESYVRGGDVYEYFGFKNAFVIVFRLMREGCNQSDEVKAKVGGFSKLVRVLKESHVMAFYVVRDSNPYNNKDFIMDCREISYVCSKMGVFLKFYSQLCDGDVQSISDLVGVEGIYLSCGGLFGDSVDPVPRFSPVSCEEGFLVRGGFRIAESRKTDFLKILTAMYDCRFFENVDGSSVRNKRVFVDGVGDFLNTSLRNASVLLNKARLAREDTFMRPYVEVLERGKLEMGKGFSD